MTTITREQQKQILIDTANHVISRDNTSPYSENLRELARIALASLEAKPIGAFHIADQQVSGTTDYIKDGEWPIDNGVIEVYAVPPASVTGIYDDVLNIIGLLENNEWAEHCTSTVLGSLLESEITRLVGKEQSAPVVPGELPREHINGWPLAHSDYAEGWNACRAAMLQSKYRDLSQPVDPQVAAYEQIMLQADNSPVTPDGWINCSERMPEIRQTVIGWNGYAVRQCVYTRNEYAKTQKGREPRFETLTGIWHGVTHWMPLPEPPQQ